MLSFRQFWLTNTKGILRIGDKSAQVSGYEIHAGASTITDLTTCDSLIELENGCVDGLISQCDQIVGT